MYSRYVPATEILYKMYSFMLTNYVKHYVAVGKRVMVEIYAKLRIARTNFRHILVIFRNLCFRLSIWNKFKLYSKLSNEQNRSVRK